MGNIEYNELRTLITQAGLLERRPVYYAVKVLYTLVLLGISLAILILVDNLWFQLLNAVFLGVVFAHIAFIGHDAGHNQITRSQKGNDMIGLAVGFLVGMIRTWWVKKHNAHHGNPNTVGKDPDLEIPLIAFDEGQLIAKGRFLQSVVRYQAFYITPMLFLEGIGLRAAGIQFLLRGEKLKFGWIEPLLMLSHFVVYFALLSLFLSFWHAVLFVIVHQGILGIYLSTSFAPNHKGMMMWDENNPPDFLRQQVLASRNMTGSRIVDFWFGGLNYQIEHHLFPSMPPYNLKEAQKIVRGFCEERNILYHETFVLKSFWEILVSLHEVGASLRTKTTAV
ncbi:MAG: fatty acid desaturase [bacterium]|nr:fatty acid desaturase [bacterium]